MKKMLIGLAALGLFSGAAASADAYVVQHPNSYTVVRHTGHGTVKTRYFRSGAVSHTVRRNGVLVKTHISRYGNETRTVRPVYHRPYYANHRPYYASHRPYYAYHRPYGPPHPPYGPPPPPYHRPY